MCALPVVLLSVLGLAVSGRCAFIEEDNCEVRVRTDAGWVCGRVRVADGGYKYASFRGIPYGKPPLGRRRFAELEPVDPWDGLYDATEDKAACPTKDLLYGRAKAPRGGESEDCIHVNIHVPDTSGCADFSNDIIDPNGRLPILVNIPGGAFETGSGLSDFHGPEYFMKKGIIMISFNYRLNVFGFLSLASREIPGNQGIRDQYHLLRWVQRNARAFGGDPNNVTLMGQSAGSFSTHALALSKATEGLFHRIILLSTTAVMGPSGYPETAKTAADAFLTNLGIDPSLDPTSIHDILVELPLEKLMESFTIIQNQFGAAVLSPVIEGEYPGVTRILDGEPIELIAEGRGRHYPTIVGVTNNECAFFRWLYINLNTVSRIEDNRRALLFGQLTVAVPEDVQDELADQVYNRCFPNGKVTLDDYINCESNKFIYGPFKYAQYRGIVGAPTYFYRFSYEGERKLVGEASWITYKGAAHADDLTYIFKVNSLMRDYDSFPPKNTDDHMKNWMTSIFTNFTRCSNPTCDPEEKNWPRATFDNLQFQDITEPYEYTVREVDGELKDMIEFYDSIDVKYNYIAERLMAIRDAETRAYKIKNQKILYSINSIKHFETSTHD